MRLRQSNHFRNVIRFGVKVGRSTMVVHMAKNNRTQPRAGFVVSKAVGNAVDRNRIKRRLRHLVAEKFYENRSLGIDVVIRANPSAKAKYQSLSVDFDSAWSSCCERITQ